MPHVRPRATVWGVFSRLYRPVNVSLLLPRTTTRFHRPSKSGEVSIVTPTVDVLLSCCRRRCSISIGTTRTRASGRRTPLPREEAQQVLLATLFHPHSSSPIPFDHLAIPVLCPCLLAQHSCTENCPMIVLFCCGQINRFVPLLPSFNLHPFPSFCFHGKLAG